jgi:hypothetical protein
MILRLKYIRQSVFNTQKQAGVFLDRYKDLLSPDNAEMIDIYSNLDKRNFFARRYYILKYGFYKMGLIRNLGLFLLI